MKEDIPDYFICEETKISFSDAITKQFIKKKRQNELSKAKILLLPLENFRKEAPLCFHHGTRSLYLFFQEKHPELTLDLSIEKNDYKEISLHRPLCSNGTETAIDP